MTTPAADSLECEHQFQSELGDASLTAPADPTSSPETPGRPPTPARRGRPPAPPAPTPVARELRRRREILRLSLREAAERTGVAHTVIAGIESGRRLPTVRTYERLRTGLGLDAPASILVRPHEPEEILDVHLVRLGACLWASGGRATLADLADALGLSVAAVREQLPAVSARLAACGVSATCDGVEVVLGPLQTSADAVAAVGRLVIGQRRAALSQDAVEVLAYIGWHGDASRRQLEDFRDEDCETLLGRLVDASLLAAVRDESAVGRPNLYRLTATALQAMSVASVEELKERMRPIIEGDGATAH